MCVLSNSFWQQCGKWIGWGEKGVKKPIRKLLNRLRWEFMRLLLGPVSMWRIVESFKSYLASRIDRLGVWLDGGVRGEAGALSGFVMDLSPDTIIWSQEYRRRIGFIQKENTLFVSCLRYLNANVQICPACTPTYHTYIAKLLAKDICARFKDTDRYQQHMVDV